MCVPYLFHRIDGWDALVMFYNGPIRNSVRALSTSMQLHRTYAQSLVKHSVRHQWSWSIIITCERTFRKTAHTCIGKCRVVRSMQQLTILAELQECTCCSKSRRSTAFMPHSARARTVALHPMDRMNGSSTKHLDCSCVYIR